MNFYFAKPWDISNLACICFPPIGFPTVISILLNKTVRPAEASAKVNEGLHNCPPYNIIIRK